LTRTEKEYHTLVDLSSEVTYNRRRRMAELMGVTNLNRLDVNRHFGSLPKVVQSAASDIGQSGLEKYCGHDGMRNKRDQGGCDEFCGWHYINTNFDDAVNNLCVGCCDHESNDEVLYNLGVATATIVADEATPAECCPSDNGCMEARCFAIDDSATPSMYICDANVFPDHGFKEAGMVAEITCWGRDLLRCGID
jgi:hypothetical protein